MKMRVIKLFGILALTLFALSCSNPLSQEPIAPTEQGLLITVSAAKPDARTLYPKEPVFSKYELELTSDGQEPVTRTITNGTTATVTGLSAGQWTVSVRGYVQIDVSPDNGPPIHGEFEVAWGEETVAVTAAGLTSREIEISADNRSGADGIFSYSVSIPDNLADWANIVLYGPSQWEYDFSGNVFSDFSSAGTLSGLAALAPGNYLMQITVGGQDVANTAARTEVVHIYSNMETIADYTFVAADFTQYFTLSGTVSAMIDGVAASGGYVNICADEDGNHEIGSYEFEENNANWEISLRATVGQTFYISVDAWDADDNWFTQKNVRSVTLANQTTTNINLNVSITSITLSGTITVTLNGATPDEAWLGIYRDADYNQLIGGAEITGTAWQAKVPNDIVGTTVYFVVYADGSVGGIEYRGEKEAGSATASTNQINLGTVEITSTEGYFTLSGTGTITIDGEPKNYGYITAYEDSDYIYDISTGYIYGESGTWEMDFPAEYLGQTIYIKVEAYDGWTRYEAEKGPITLSMPLPVQNITHNFTKPALEELQGTVTISGSPIVGQELSVNCYPDNANGESNIQWYSGDDPVGYGYEWYLVQASDVGKIITVRVSYSGNSGSLSSKTGTVIAAGGIIAVEFTGFGEEEIDLSGNNANDFSQSQRQELHVTVNDSYYSYQWYVDGEYRDSSAYLYLYPSEFTIGVHSVTVVVTDWNNVPYSKELTFRVVR